MSQKDEQIAKSLSDEQIVYKEANAQPSSIPRAPLKDLRELVESAKSCDDPNELVSVPLKTLRQMLAVAEKYQQMRRQTATGTSLELVGINVTARRGDSGAGADYNDSSHDSADRDVKDMSNDTDTQTSADVKDNDY